jgi:hypothetical protein
VVVSRLVRQVQIARFTNVKVAAVQLTVLQASTVKLTVAKVAAAKSTVARAPTAKLPIVRAAAVQSTAYRVPLVQSNNAWTVRAGALTARFCPEAKAKAG